MLAGIIGIVLFWRGIWDLSEKVFSPEWSLVLGLGLLAFVALIERKMLYKFLGVV